VFFLPGNSPELNQDVQSHAGRQRRKDQVHIMRSLRGHLRSTQKQPAKVWRYFHEEQVAYAAASECSLLIARSNSLPIRREICHILARNFVELRIHEWPTVERDSRRNRT